MDEIIEKLEQSGRYRQLLTRWYARNNDEIRFEVLFAYWCESRGLSLNYEVAVNPDNDKTVDFNFVTNSDVVVNVELVRPNLNKGIREHLSGDLSRGYVLTSDDENEDFRTAAQLIKLQWALLDKVKKFPSLSERTINIIVADCSNVHAGMFDHYDLGMAMYGDAGNPIWEEYWDGKKLRGMWEKGFNPRESKEFCEKISAVIFVPKQQPELLEKALAAVNPVQGKEHRQLMMNELRTYQAFIDVQVVCKRRF